MNRVTLSESSGSRLLAGALTWWTLLLEGSIALMFLWPDSRRSAIIRNCMLLGFGVTTYAVAHVRGFGWMLMLLGLAQCTDRDKEFRAAYFAVFLLIQAYMLPLEPLVDWLFF